MQQKVRLIELDQNNQVHLNVMYSVRSNPDVDRYLRGCPPTNFDSHVSYLQNVGSLKKFYLIEVNTSLSGYCQLTVSDVQVEIGMALHPDYYSKGIGSVAMSKLLNLLQNNEEFKNKSLILFVKKDNLRAISLYTKYGFMRKGEENEHGEYLMKKGQ